MDLDDLFPDKPDDPLEPPEWLLPYAKDEWRRLAPTLHNLGLLTEVDLQPFAGYCQSFARWRLADEWIQQHGATIVIKDKDGRVKYVQQVPYVAIAAKEKAAMTRLAAEFGFTPSSRTGVTVERKTKSVWEAI